MNDPTEHDPFARDDGSDNSPHTQIESADGRAVHGLLALLLPGEAMRVQERVNCAIARIRSENKPFRTKLRRRLGWIGGSVGIAAAIAIALLYVPTDSSSQAFAALESIRSSARQSGQTYSVRIEMDPPSIDGPIDVDRPQPMKHVRAGELVLGSGGRWTFTILAPLVPTLRIGGQGDSAGTDRRPPRAKGVFGFDGKTYWAVEPMGAIRNASSLRELRPPMIFGALDTGSAESDSELEPLTLEAMLDKLDRGYTVTFEQANPADLKPNRPVTVVSAKRLPGDQRRIGAMGPTSVRIVADASTFEVLTAQWDWDATVGPPAGTPHPQSRPGFESDSVRKAIPAKFGIFGKKRIFLEITDGDRSSAGADALEDLDWFDANSHTTLGVSPKTP